MIIEAATWLREASLDAVEPAAAGLFGGALLWWLRRRQTDKRQRQELAQEMVRVAYTFYRRLQVSIREHAATKKPPAIDKAELRQAYEPYRLEARLLEAKAAVYGAKAKWFWHLTVDTLDSQYYKWARSPEEFDRMRTKHQSHAEDQRLPRRARELVLKNEVFNTWTAGADPDAIAERIAELLDLSVEAVLGVKRPILRLLRITR